MCDFNRISGYIIGAQTAYLVSLGIVTAAILLGSNPFTSAANIPAMAIASALAAVAAGLLIGAIASVDECAGSPCGAQVAPLRANLIALSATMGTFGILLAAFALIAAIPFAGSAGAVTLCTWALTLTSAFSAAIEGYLGNTVQQFNMCMQQQNKGNDTTTTVIVVTTVIAALLSVFIGAYAGKSQVRCLGSKC